MSSQIIVDRNDVSVIVGSPTSATISVTPPIPVTITAGAIGPQGPVGATGAAGTSPIFSRAGTLAVSTGGSRLYFERTGTITRVRAAVGTAPTGGSVVVDVKRNGSSIFANPADRPTITAGTFTALGTPSTVQIVPDDFLTVDIVEVGGTFAGADLTVTLTID